MSIDAVFVPVCFVLFLLVFAFSVSAYVELGVMQDSPSLGNDPIFTGLYGKKCALSQCDEERI